MGFYQKKKSSKIKKLRKPKLSFKPTKLSLKSSKRISKTPTVALRSREKPSKFSTKKNWHKKGNKAEIMRRKTNFTPSYFTTAQKASEGEKSRKGAFPKSQVKFVNKKTDHWISQSA